MKTQVNRRLPDVNIQTNAPTFNGSEFDADRPTSVNPKRRIASLTKCHSRFFPLRLRLRGHFEW